MAQFRVLVPLPISSDRRGQGQTVGDVVELNADEARVFLLIGSVQPVEVEASGRRSYRRRDVVAEV